MRQTHRGELSLLMPRVRERLLAELLLHSDRDWYRSDLARRLRLTPSTLQRELARLVKAGILSERKEGNRSYFRANTQSPIYPELRSLMAKTSGLAGVLRESLRDFSAQIRFAFVFGSLARGEERPDSDVDLLIVGTVRRPELVRALREAEHRLGRPVNAQTYTPAEIAAKRAQGHHFVREVIEGSKIFVFGSEHDLENPRR